MIKLKPFRQSEDKCGPACVKIILDHYGREYSEEELAKIAHTTPDIGTNHEDLVTAVETLGLTPAVKSNATLDDLKAYLSKDVPVIVGWWDVDEYHYSVIFDIDDRQIRMMDPDSETGECTMPIPEFEKVWYDTDSELDTIVRRWMMAIPKN